MRRNTNKMKSKFGRNLKIYAVILSLFCIMFLIYVMNTLYQYEDSFTDNYMKNAIVDIKKIAVKGKLDQYCNFDNIKVSELENNKQACKSEVEQKFKNTNITYKFENNDKTKQEAVYSIYSNDEKFMEMTLNVKKHNNRLGMFSYPTWQIKECNLKSERGMYYYDILVPSNYVVTVNSTKLSDIYISDSKTDEGYDILSKYIELPKMVKYKLDNFVSQPEIKITDENGNNMQYEINNHKVELSSIHKYVNSYEEAKKYLAKDINVLDIAQKWSLFLTDDLKGEKHGFGELNKYLVKGTSIYNMASSWATSIDITFTSKHSLKNPAFTNIKVSDFDIYGKNAFSCTVYLEKNMKIANGNDKVDVMHDKLYFVYYDGTDDEEDNPCWKMVDMKAVTKK